MEEKTIVQGIDELIHWEMYFQLLSLERVEPFLNELGLKVLDVNAMRTIARHFLEQVQDRNINVNDPEASSQLADGRQMIQDAFEEIAAVMGRQTADDIQQRILEDFSMRYKGLFYWSQLLQWELANLSGRENPPEPPAIESNKLQTIVDMIRKEFGDYLEFDKRLEEADSLPKSVWDEYIYKIYEGEPLITVSVLINDYRTQKVWKFIKTLLTNEDLDVLLQWAKSQAPRLRIKSEKIDLLF